MISGDTAKEHSNRGDENGGSDDDSIVSPIVKKKKTLSPKKKPRKSARKKDPNHGVLNPASVGAVLINPPPKQDESNDDSASSMQMKVSQNSKPAKKPISETSASSTKATDKTSSAVKKKRTSTTKKKKTTNTTTTKQFDEENVDAEKKLTAKPSNKSTKPTSASSSSTPAKESSTSPKPTKKKTVSLSAHLEEETKTSSSSKRRSTKSGSKSVVSSTSEARRQKKSSSSRKTSSVSPPRRRRTGTTREKESSARGALQKKASSSGRKKTSSGGGTRTKSPSSSPKQGEEGTTRKKGKRDTGKNDVATAASTPLPITPAREQPKQKVVLASNNRSRSQDAEASIQLALSPIPQPNSKKPMVPKRNDDASDSESSMQMKTRNKSPPKTKKSPVKGKPKSPVKKASNNHLLGNEMEEGIVVDSPSKQSTTEGETKYDNEDDDAFNDLKMMLSSAEDAMSDDDEEEERRAAEKSTSHQRLPVRVPFFDGNIDNKGGEEGSVNDCKGEGKDQEEYDGSHRTEYSGQAIGDAARETHMSPNKDKLEPGGQPLVTHQSSGPESPERLESSPRNTSQPTTPATDRSQIKGKLNNLFSPSNTITPTSAPKKQETADWISKKQADYMNALATPRRGKKAEILETPTMTPRLTLKALNVATPRAKNRSSTPPKRRGRKAYAPKDDDSMLEGYVRSAISLLNDIPKYKDDVRDAIYTIHGSKGFPQSRRLSMRDNELICDMIGAIQNDPTVTNIEIDCDPVFGAVQTTLLFNFLDSLRMNLHLTTLQFRGVELGNDFLYALASSLESNFALKRIDLSVNCFTSEGLVEFCKALGSLNETCEEVILENQTTPIAVSQEEDVLDAFRQNRVLTKVKVDFQSGDEGSALLEEILKLNQERDKSSIDLDEKIVEVYRDMAELAHELHEQKKAEELVLKVPEDDWEYLQELAVLFEKHKLKKEIQAESLDELSGNQRTIKENLDLTGKKKSEFLFGKFRDILNESVACFNSDGSFLTDEFISKFVVEDEDTSSIVFDFHGQWKLFKRFPPQDPHRGLIVTKFVHAIVRHPRAAEFTGVSMANTGCGNDFLETLSQRLIDDPALLPNLQMINFETNFINETGVVALSNLIAHPTAAKYLQVVRLENQKGLLKSKAEMTLMKALCVNRSVVVLGLKLRNLLEKQQIFKYLVRNIDFIRQARQRHAKVMGRQRARNEVEKFFDRVAENDPTIDKVDMSSRKRFLTLTPEEKQKAAASFARNTVVKLVNFNTCEIDDEFAIELAKAIRTNGSIEKIFLENNSISGEGVKALFDGLGENTSIEEIRLHHQSKMIISADEEILADALESNTTVVKIGIDLRNKVAQVRLDRKLKHNINNQLKRRAEENDGDFKAEESYLFLK